jgi:hypothetical protein
MYHLARSCPGVQDSRCTPTTLYWIGTLFVDTVKKAFQCTTYRTRSIMMSEPTIAFCIFVYRHCCTWLNHVQQLTYAYVRVFEEMLQESWPPATAILREYIPVWTMYVPNCLFLYTSIVCWAMKAVQAILKAVWRQLFKKILYGCMFVYIHIRRIANSYFVIMSIMNVISEIIVS